MHAGKLPESVECLLQNERHVRHTPTFWQLRLIHP
jgi:hypothetical protein